MKRKDLKDLKADIDQLVLAMVQQNKGKRKELGREVRRFLQDHDTLSTRDLYQWCAGLLVSASKQSLRKEGVIEIGRKGVAKIASALKPEDLESINTRRLGKAHGLLRNQAVWCHSNGMIDDCRSYLEMLRVIAPQEAEQLERELFPA